MALLATKGDENRHPVWGGSHDPRRAPRPALAFEFSMAAPNVFQPSSAWPCGPPKEMKIGSIAILALRGMEEAVTALEESRP